MDVARPRLLTLAATLTAAALALAGCGSSHPAHARALAPASTTPTPTQTVTHPATPRPTYPLTGLPVTDPAHARRPALSFKIDNVAGSFPQAGLNSADLVADCLVEGGLTRLFATFQSADAPVVGPIRSARPVDADLLALYRGSIFGYSGAALGEIAPTIQHGDAVRLSFDNDPGLFHLDHSYAAPHDVFTSTSTLWKAGLARQPHLTAPPALFRYGPLQRGGRLATGVSLPFSPVSSAGWQWNGHDWVRTQEGTPDRLTDGSQVSTTNIVVMSVATVATPITDAAGNHDPLDVIIGSGPVWLLRDGHVETGTWSRPSYRARMVLRDAAGHELLLKPGRTWLELLPRPNQPSFS